MLSASLNKTFLSLSLIHIYRVHKQISKLLILFETVALKKSDMIRKWRTRCKSMVEHPLMVQCLRIDPSWWTQWAISRSSKCSMTGVTDGMCYPVCGMVHIKDHLLLDKKSNPFNVGSGFTLSLRDSLPHVRCHIIVNKMCWRYH